MESIMLAEGSMPIDRILTIGGLAFTSLLAYYFYIKSMKQKEPFYYIRSNNLIQDNLSQMSGLNISYSGQKVENLTVSQIIFWNRGSEIINKDDIVISEPLRIESLANI
jgi:hypothetical protein